MSKSLVLLLGAASLLATVTPGYSQTASHGTVVSVCSEVADAERDEQNALRGQCLAATSSFLDGLRNAQLSLAAFDQSISDLVVDLTDLLFTPLCVRQSEVAQAIALANAQVENPEQKAQILLIYQTVTNCDFGITAAVSTPVPNTFPPASLVGGPSASDS